jgi:pyridoxal phosphate enzyme (YggS family)
LVSEQVATALAERVARVRDEVADAARAAGRRPEEIAIVAVSKTVPRPVVDAAAALGLRHFGENRVQEARDKFTDPLPPGCDLHLIGQLQSNKAKLAVRLFDMIESVDRASLIDALEKAARQQERVVPVLLQVNIAGEAQKAGCAPEEAAALMERIVASSSLEPRGFMTIAPLVPDPELARPVFAALRELRDDLKRRFPDQRLGALSMGMSNDYRVAIEEGATTIRVGRAIFA